MLSLEAVVEGMKIIEKDNFVCEIYVENKMPQTRNREKEKRATKPLERVYCDLAGPITPMARDGFEYSLCLVDDYTGINMVYFLKQKSDTVEATKKNLSDSSPYGKVQILGSHNGGEFFNKDFKDLLLNNQIKHETTCPYSPHQNGKAERFYFLFEMARCLINESKLPENMWTYAVMCAAYIRNRCFVPRLGITAYEGLTHVKPKLNIMHNFGCTCYAYIQKPKKLEPRSEKGVFVGYHKGSTAYLVYFPVIKKVRCVKFIRELQNSDKPCGESPTVGIRLPPPNADVTEPKLQQPLDDGDSYIETGNIAEPTVNAETDEDDERRYPLRNRKKPYYLGDYVAMEDEMQSLRDNNTFT